MEPGTLDTVLLPLYVIIFISGVIGNSLFITVVRKRRCMHTTVNLLLANVALSDMISLLFCLPGIVLRFFEHPRGSLGNFLCKFVSMHLVAGVTLLVSGQTLTFIAIERHNALLRPMDLRLKLAKRRVAIAVCFIWGVSIVLVMPLFVKQEYAENVQDCFIAWSGNASRVYWCFLASIVSISLCIMCICYLRVVTAFYLKKVLPPNDHSREQDIKDKQKITKLLITISVLFLICFLPFITASAIQISTQKVFYKLSYLLVYASCSVNPAVYGIQSANYRSGLKDLWKGISFQERERSLES